MSKKLVIRNATIIGTGSYTPDQVYTNEYLEQLVDTSSEWIQRTLGIKERKIAGENEATSDLGAKAALNAIDASNIAAEDIDLIICATSTPDRLAPSTACIIQDKIKAYNAAAFDVAAVCSGFLYAMAIGSQFIASHVYDNVLIIGADTFSTITDWTKRDCVFFGDGAGAAVLSHAENTDGFLAFRLYADGRGKWNFTVPAGGSEMPSSPTTLENGLHYFTMNGKEVYNTATQVLPKAIYQVLNDVGLSIEDIKYLIPHQPSIGILKKTAELINMPFEKVRTNMDRYANTSGGTIPILLDEVCRANLINSGDILLFAAVGSGWTYGSAIIKWNNKGN